MKSVRTPSRDDEWVTRAQLSFDFIIYLLYQVPVMCLICDYKSLMWERLNVKVDTSTGKSRIGWSKIRRKKLLSIVTRLILTSL